METAPRTNRAQQGYSLAEVLVATAIFTIIFIAALMIYDRSNKVFKESVESGDMQQSTRVAFDQLTSDLRMTGFDYDRDGRPFGLLGIAPWQPDTTYTLGNVIQPNPPNGHAYVAIQSGKSADTAAGQPDWPEGEKDTVEDGTNGLEWQERGILQYQQPDEQLEYIGTNAITLRGNLDYELDAANDNGREDDLESEYFPVVTTHNDEIVTYALKSADDSKNDDTIVFYADVAIPRNVHPAAGEKEAEIKIEGVDLTNDNPPYTLYRYTIDANGEPDAGTPIADNIRSINFTYFKDTAGTEVVAPNGGAGQYDASAPGETAERIARREIRSIHLELVGMSPQVDFAYTNPSDAVVPNNRTYRLEAMLVPRNLGRRGMKQLSVEPPGAPTIKAVCSGNCDVAYVTWEPPTVGEVITYNVVYDKDLTGGFTYLEDVGNTLEAFVSKDLVSDDTDLWYFKVQAVNPHGFATSGEHVQITMLNRTKPGTATALLATEGAGALPNQIDLTWPAITTNDPTAKMLVCSDGSAKEQATFPANEDHSYHVYRGTSADFNPAAGEGIVLVDDSTTLQPDSLAGTFTLSDKTAANCKDYYYRIQLTDSCHTNASWNSPANTATGEGALFPPIGTDAIHGYAESFVVPQVVTQATVLGAKNCAGMSGNNCEVEIGWAAVMKDTGDPAADIVVDRYIIESEMSTDNGATWTPQGSVPVTGGALTGIVANQDKTNLYRYRVRAANCGAEGDPSAWVIWPCDFNAVVAWNIPNFGGAGTLASPFLINGATGMTVTVNPAAEKIEVWTPTTAVQEKSGASANFTIPDVADDVATPVYINVTDSVSKCSRLFVVYVEDEAPPTCPSILVTADLSGDTVRIRLTNTSSQALTMKRLKLVWNFNETPTGKGADIASVKYDGSNATKISGTKDASGKIPITTYIYDAPTTANTLAGSEANFPIDVVFSLGNKDDLAIVPIDSICIELSNAQNDTLVCGVTVTDGGITTANTCSIP